MLVSFWWEYVRQNWRKEEGQTMAEYGVVLAVITAGVIVAFTALSGGVTNALNKVTTILTSSARTEDRKDARPERGSTDESHNQPRESVSSPHRRSDDVRVRRSARGRRLGVRVPLLRSSAAESSGS